MLRLKLIIAAGFVLAIVAVAPHPLGGRQRPASLEKISLPTTTLALERRTHPGAFFDVVGRRAAVVGYEHRGFEAWVYPLEILEDFDLSFALEGYPLEIPGRDILATITARPESTTFTYSHAAFSVREIIYAPVDEPAAVILLDVQTTLPIRITAAFRPRLRLMWPAGSMTPNTSWRASSHLYAVSEETGKFAGAILAPGARDLSLMPYQEEPRDVPVRFAVDASVEDAATRFIPIVISGSVSGVDDAVATAERVLASSIDVYRRTVEHYTKMLDSTTSVTTPEERLDRAFVWAKVGVDKGIATNPLLGTGLVAGFRSAGDSERPGFAWFFGRDSLWTVLASTSVGDFETVKTALAFLATFQREDGKIPHEISQSASLIPWFTDYPYPWASADATPLYVVAHADYWRASGDVEFLKSHWDSILKAYRFSAATDTDGNALIENTKVGHGWVEGGALYPAHEEIYMQGVWIAALRGLAELADVMQDQSVASAARATAERVSAAVEETYWLEARGFYAFATALPRTTASVAEAGPNRARRQARLDALRQAARVDEDTVLPAVPLWWRTLNVERAQRQIDRLGSAAIATDWGARLLSARSELYDPLSYHYGSVWPLFTGWASMAAYQHGRPHVGYQALVANALLTGDGALGYVTELLSGDFNAAFGRSSHHQIWSEAMVLTPLVRGLLGLHVGSAPTASTAGARRHVLRFAPQLPADWPRVSADRVVAGRGLYKVELERGDGQMRITIERTSGQPSLARLEIAPSWPLDARVVGATVNGRTAKADVTRIGDVQRAQVTIESPTDRATLVFRYEEGSDVYAPVHVPPPGAENSGLRILRATAEKGQLRLVLEGRGARTYPLFVRTPHRVGPARGVTVQPRTGADTEIAVAFEGPAGDYVRREIGLPLR